MPLTVRQTADFFTEATQMSIPARTVTQLAVEGIATVDDLGEFEKEDFKQLVSNLASPPPTLGLAPAGGGPAPLIPTQAFTLGVKSLRRLKVASHAVRYYDSIDRPLTANMMHYGDCLIHFELQWNALLKREEDDQPDVPKITRNLRVTKWSESFIDFLHRVNGIRHAPLAYVVRPNEAVGPAPALIHQRPYSADHGSIEGELIARLSHTSPLFRDDNAKVYGFLEEATRGTTYSSSLKSYTRTKNGRGAYLAIISQHAGQDKWQTELTAQENFIKTRVWKGNTNFALDKFCDQHRSAFISLQQCSEHIPYQLPNEHTRVTYLMNAIKCADAELQAALAAIKIDTVGPAAKRNNFEPAVAFLLPADPVARRRKENGNVGSAEANISSVGGGPGGTKPSIGKTGVQFRYYKKKEYAKLSDEQKVELKEWREKQQNGKDGGAKNGESERKRIRREISSIMKEESEKKEKKAKKSEQQLNDIKEVLTEIITPAPGAPAQKRNVSTTEANATASAVATDAKTTAMATKLQAIMSRGGDKI